jgi:hypothetical protein
LLTEAAERQMAINRRDLTWLQLGHRNHETKSHTGVLRKPMIAVAAW